MRPLHLLPIPFVLAAALAARSAPTPPRDTAPPLELRWTPEAPAPGSVIRIAAASSGALPPDSLISGRAAGEPLHFHREGDSLIALAGVPVDAADSLRVLVVAGGDSVTAMVPLPPIPPDTAKPREKLEVARRFSRPDDAARNRLARESALAMAVSRGAHDTPRLWTAPFIRPRPSRITSHFGSGRVFNGELQSRHLGLDLAGTVGAPVRAANRGIVRLVGDFSLAGNCIYLDHGDGVVTAYFHLSKVLVAEGDTVSRGQLIGRVGATGRVTGPHLHWVARYGAVTVDPLSLVRATR